MISTARCTLMASSGATVVPLTTRETVLRLTPASAATSFIVGRRPFGSACVARAESRPSRNAVTPATGVGRGSWSRRCDLSGPAREQLRRDHHGPGVRGEALEAGEQQLAGVAAERVGVLCDDGHAGLDEVAEGHVVEADDGHVALAAKFPQREDRADRDEVLGGEERR